MSFDPSRLRRGEWIVGAGSVLLLVSILLLPWYGGSHTVDGWNALTRFRWLAVLTLAVAAALLFFQATRPAPALPVTLSLFVAVLGTLTAAWLIYRVGINPAGGEEDRGVGRSGRRARNRLRRLCLAAPGGHLSGDAPAVIPTVDPWARDGS